MQGIGVAICGICGIVDFHNGASGDSVIGAMTRAILHRGPDANNTVRLGPASLGHARLSIIDLTDSGGQPMSSRDGRYTICYNGEVYNFRELRERLLGLGAKFRGASDTEVVLEAYARWGLDALPMFNGMFALAIWDAVDQRLLLARDRFGIKPLFYCQIDNGIVFGSEIKAILASGRVDPAMSATGLAQYMYFGNCTGSDTMFAGIEHLSPGTSLSIQSGRVHQESFWRIESVSQHRPDLHAASESVRDRLNAAVRSHLISDVPVGVFLSGGIDSSAITALASRHYSGKLHTYSVGFDFDRGVNELPKARRVAEQFGTVHHELHVRGGDLASVIEQLVVQHDQPFADAANIPLYLLCKELAGSVKVVLQGDGGDEIFAGYRRHNAMSFEWMWRRVARMANLCDSLLPRNGSTERFIRFMRLFTHRDRAIGIALLFTQDFVQEPPARVLSRELREEVLRQDPFTRYRRLYERTRELPIMQQVLYMDTMGPMIDTFMEKVDRSTMAHGIEARVPFLDSELSEYVLGLPSDMKVKRGQKKRVLRAALRGIVSDDVLDGPKTGFEVPFAYWIGTSLAGYCRDVVVCRGADELGLFDRAIVERCIDDHAAGRRNCGFLLYKLLNLVLWWERYLIRPPNRVNAASLSN